MLCRDPATAVLLFDPRVATAWLVDVGGSASTGLPMCASHSSRFRAPVGWTLSDQRSQSGLVTFSAPSVAPDSASAPSRTEDAGEDSGDVDEGDVTTEPEPAPTPLLSRAFRTTAQALI